MNDLIGLQYQWGARFADGKGYTDCFQLVCEIRKRLGLSDYSGKFEVRRGEMTGAIQGASGNIIRVQFSAEDPTTGRLFRVDLPPVTSPATADISGRWDNPYGGGFVEFIKEGPFAISYSFQEFDPGGTSHGQGKVVLENGLLRVGGHNDFFGDYSGALKIRDTMITGVTRDSSGAESRFVLLREGSG